LAAAAIVGSDRHVGQAVGYAYAANTLGNIAGSLGAVFVLLPLGSVESGLRASTLLYAAASGALVLWLNPRPIAPRMRNVVVVMVVAVMVAGALWPRWNIGVWTAGLYRVSLVRGYFQNTMYKPSNLEFHRDGLAATVTVEEDDGIRWIKVDGKIDGSSSGDMPTQVLSGALRWCCIRIRSGSVSSAVEAG